MGLLFEIQVVFLYTKAWTENGTSAVTHLEFMFQYLFASILFIYKFSPFSNQKQVLSEPQT